MFSFGGLPISFSFGLYHSARIPNSEIAIVCPNVVCEWATFENDPESSGTVTIGSDRIASVGSGVVLEPGQSTGWIPIRNIDQVWHKESDATTYLRYSIVGYSETPANSHLLQEDRNHILQEDLSRIIIT